MHKLAVVVMGLFAISCNSSSSTSAPDPESPTPPVPETPTPAAAATPTPAVAATPTAPVAATPTAPVAATPTAPVAAEDAKPAPEAPAIKMGVYVESHSAFTDCDDDDGCQEQVEDRLTIKKIQSGVAVVISLSQDNDHECYFEGQLAERGPGEWGWTNPKPEDGGDCEVILTIKETSLLVDSEGCRSHCGARARLLASFEFSGLQP